MASYLRRKGFGLQSAELGFYEHSIDLYAINKRTKRTVAVELKLTKWRRAFEQALLYQLCADYVYVAVPSTTVPGVNQELLAGYGVGLIAVTGTTRCREILKPTRSDVMRKSYRSTYIKIVQELENGSS